MKDVIHERMVLRALESMPDPVPLEELINRILLYCRIDRALQMQGLAKDTPRSKHKP